MRSGNPVLKDDSFQNSTVYSASDIMTVNGAVMKTFALAILLIMAGAFSWRQSMLALSAQNPGTMSAFVLGGSIGGLVLALITTFKRNWAPFTAPFYAIAEGIVLGALSLMFELRFPGIALQASLCTVSALLATLFLYKTGLIKVNDTFRSTLAIATFGIFLVYFLGFVLGFFNIKIPLIHEGGLVGIGFSALVIVVASLNLILDFDFIQKAASSTNQPKYMEWYAAFALLVTLVWLYIEFLRLLAKLRERR